MSKDIQFFSIGEKIGEIDKLYQVEDPLIDISRQDEYRHLRNLINTKLLPKEMEIICMSYGFYDGKIYTNQEIARYLNIQEQVVNILKKQALLKIKLMLENDNSYNKQKKFK